MQYNITWVRRTSYVVSLFSGIGARDGTATSGANDWRDSPPRAGVGTGAIIGAEDGMGAIIGAEDRMGAIIGAEDGTDPIIGAEDGTDSIIGAEDGTDSMRLLGISASFLSRTCTELSPQ
jgi:hypothetical protein